MVTLKVVNIKCGGCEKGIIDALEKGGLRNVRVDHVRQEVSFDGDADVAERILTRLGYPRAGTAAATSLLKKARSYETCAIGTISDGVESKAKRTGKFWMIIVALLLIAVAGLGAIALVAQRIAPRDAAQNTAHMRASHAGGNAPVAAQRNAVFSTDTEGLPMARPSEVVVLRDGDTYEMTATIVQQEVGNRIVRRLAYNGMIPGPRLQVPQGATVTIVLKNELPLPTTLHSHGLRLDDAFDGVPLSMGGAQKPLQPGETFRYTITFPDAGVYWYHPHIREDYTQELGLYGNYHVTADGYWAPADREVFWIVDDFSEDDPFYVDRVNKTMRGRYGNLLMINNQAAYTMTARTGEYLRFFVTNTANTRTFDLSLVREDGAEQTLRIVGGDIGRIEREVDVTHFVIAPAERVVYETVFTAPGVYTIRHRGVRMGTIRVEGASQAVVLPQPRDNAADYAAIRARMEQWLAQAPDKRLRLTIGMKGMRGAGGPAREMRRGMRHRDGAGRMVGGTYQRTVVAGNSRSGVPYITDTRGILWEEDMARMNAMTSDAMMEWMIVDEATGKVNGAMRDDWVFRRGQMVKIEVYNDPDSMHPMQHPIHFHGQRFVILSRDGVPNDNLQWKDTALVRAGERMTLLVDMSNPGRWMAHCHIAEHLHAGMMFNFRVEE